MCFEDTASLMAKKVLEFVGRRRTIIVMAVLDGECCQVRSWVLNPDFPWKYITDASDTPLLTTMTKLAVDSIAKKRGEFPLPEGFFMLNENTSVGLIVDAKNKTLRNKCLFKMKE